MGHEPRYLIGIGAQKCASTWLFDVLSRHPEVATPRSKELDFFSHRHDRGHLWYAECWRGQSALCRTENSPSYLTHPGAAARVAAFAPKAQVIFTLRDPVERAYSHHLHEVARGHIPPMPFETALDTNPSYLSQGMYAQALRPWFDAFPEEARFGLFAEDLRLNPGTAWEQVLAFAKLRDCPLPALGSGMRNVSDQPRNAMLRNSLRAGGRALSFMGLEDLRESLRRAPVLSQILCWNARPLRKVIDPPSAALSLQLARYFADDMRALCGMLGRDSLPWPSWQAVAGDHKYPADRNLSAARRPAMRLPSGTGWVPSADMKPDGRAT